jgi:hypothetical protein
MIQRLSKTNKYKRKDDYECWSIEIDYLILSFDISVIIILLKLILVTNIGSAQALNFEKDKDCKNKIVFILVSV